MLVVPRREVEELLDLERLVEALGAAMADVSAGRASMPPRVAARVPAQGAMLAAMAAHLPAGGALTTKLVSLFPRDQDPDAPGGHRVLRPRGRHTGGAPRRHVHHRLPDRRRRRARVALPGP